MFPFFLCNTCGKFEWQPLNVPNTDNLAFEYSPDVVWIADVQNSFQYSFNGREMNCSSFFKYYHVPLLLGAIVILSE